MYGMSPRAGYRRAYPRMRVAPPMMPMMPPARLPFMPPPPPYYGPGYYAPPPPPMVPVPGIVAPLVAPFRRPRFGPRYY